MERFVDLLTSRDSKRRQSLKDSLAKKDITNEILLQEIDTVFIRAQNALQNDYHSKVAKTFLMLLTYDLLWRRCIGDQLIPISSSRQKILSANKMNFVVLVQSYFNSFRTSLLVEIVNYLMHQGYNKVTKMIKDNLELATSAFAEVKALSNFYTKTLKIWFTIQQKRKPDEHLQKLFEECNDAFKEVKDSSIHCIRTALNEQLTQLSIMNSPY
ncbi:MAG: hypothetical protein ACXAC7_02805 [Candidatus Hodarchaeales archaeon]|jgi:hypothetical protein